MFTRVGPNEAESTEGFTVKRVSRHALEYRTGEKRLIVEVEPGVGLAVYQDSIRSWESPHEREPVSEAEKALILDRIGRALAFLGIEYLIQ